MDIVIAFAAGVASLIFYPFVILAIKIEDGKEIFSVQERIGKNNKPIKLLKFRTMTFANDGGKWGNDNHNQITRVGRFLRNSRIDELPQLWNVLWGDISLVGPRPEFADAVGKYEKEIPYYSVRHLVKPGLSGWAQIYGEHAHHEADFSKTKNKLSYDLYYIKNRSLMLDLKIALKTIKALLSRSGI
jgi:lipopolysaccharide/colanic/teichoic acid biosynthesis glycosyltransferase